MILILKVQKFLFLGIYFPIVDLELLLKDLAIALKVDLYFLELLLDFLNNF